MSPTTRARVERLRIGIVRVVAVYGSLDRLDARRALELADGQEQLGIDAAHATYFVTRVTFVPRRELRGMAMWRKRLFLALGASGTTAARAFTIPSDAIVELGTRVDV